MRRLHTAVSASTRLCRMLHPLSRHSPTLLYPIPDYAVRCSATRFFRALTVSRTLSPPTAAFA